jgi:hypothetical protein
MLILKEENENKYSFYERIIARQNEEFLSGIGGIKVDESTEIR